MDLLARQDPVLDQILYYHDIPLFEDELHDNGESILNARIVRLPLCPLFLLTCSPFPFHALHSFRSVLSHFCPV